METVLKTTMYEITRLVEESFVEQMDRGKREAEVLKRRLIVSEAKLRERERFKKVRCVDCGRTAVSRRRLLHVKGPETQNNLDNALVVKQENASDSSWRCSPKGSTNQEKPSATPEPKQNAVQQAVCEPKPAGEVKEETKEPRDTQLCLKIHSQLHKQKDPQSSVQETNGLRSADSTVTSCTELDEDEARHRSPTKWFNSKTDPRSALVSQPEPETPCLRPQMADSSPIKQEVVVMLPSDWEDMEIRPHNSAKKTHLPPSARVQERVSFPPPPPPVKRQIVPTQAMQNLRVPVKKNTKIVVHPNAAMSDHGAVDLNRSLPAPKLSQVRQYPEGAGERSFNTMNPGRSLPPVVNMRVQVDARNISAKTTHNCSQCGKGFSHLCHLRAHQQIHTGDRQFCCTICGRSFTKLSNLKAHRRVHTGERPYICADCGKRFTQKCNLKRHQRIHSEFTHSSV